MCNVILTSGNVKHLQQIARVLFTWSPLVPRPDNFNMCSVVWSLFVALEVYIIRPVIPRIGNMNDYYIGHVIFSKNYWVAIFFVSLRSGVKVCLFLFLICLGTPS